MSETTNYEVGKTTRHTVTPLGSLARLSVAVIVDDEHVTTKGADGNQQVSSKPWEKEGLDRINKLVAASVGLNTERGDTLTVENISFETPAVEPELPANTAVQQMTDVVKQQWPMAVRGLVAFALAMLALFGVIRPIARGATRVVSTPAALPAVPGVPGARLPTVKEMEGQIEAELDAQQQAGVRRLPVLTKRVAKLASDEPEQLARIVRGWIAEGDR
jgi:flagellar M-ring protein FliF